MSNISRRKLLLSSAAAFVTPELAKATTLLTDNLSITLASVTANTTFAIPAGFAIRDIYVTNITGNAVTGGINIGTTNGGTDVVSAFAVAGFAFSTVGSSISKKTFSVFSATTLYLQAASAWNSASLNVVISIAQAEPSLIGSLVPGYAAYWPMDQLNATLGAVQNAAALSTPLSSNIFRGSIRLFSNTVYWTGSGYTAVDSAVADPNGNQQASTLVWTAGGFMSYRSSDTIVAGTYTLAINAKRNTGSNQSFCFSKDSFGSRSSTQTATASWQRFTYTFTLGGTTALSAMLIGDISGGTGANLQVCNFELYAGSSDLGPATQVGHLYFAQSPASAPSLSGGWVDCSSGNFGLSQLPFSATANFESFTVMAVVDQVASGSSYQAFLSNVQDYTQFAPNLNAGTAPTLQFGGQTIAPTIPAGFWGTNGAGPLIIGAQYDGSYYHLWLNGAEIWTGFLTPDSPTVISPVTVLDMFMNIASNTSFYAGLKYNGLLLYVAASGAGGAISPTQYIQNYSVLKNRAALSAISLSSVRFVAAEGDSITNTGGLATAYPIQYAAAPPSPICFGVDWAIAGSALADVNARAQYLDLACAPTIGADDYILSLLIGANDGPAWGTASAYAAALQAYGQARMARGWKFILCTILPRAIGNGGPPDTAFNTWRDAVNAIIYSWTPGLYYTALADFAGNATMGQDTSAGNTTYYIGGLHPTTAGHTILLSIIGPIYNSL